MNAEVPTIPTLERPPVVVDAGAPPPPPRRKPRGRYQRFAHLLIAPAALLMLLVHLIPSAGGVFTSLLDLNTFTISEQFGAPFAGFENYTELFESDSPLRSGLQDALRNTAIYTVITVAAVIGGGLGLALLLNRSFPGNRAARTLMIAPWVLPSFVVAMLWQVMLQSESGIVNKLLVDYTGLLETKPVWLIGDNALWAITFPSIWRGLPFAALIFLAGLQAIPRELHEAAAIDGAGPWRRFRHVTLPLLRPLIGIQLLFGVVYTAYQFTIPYIMLGRNPGSDGDLVMTLIMRESFSNNLFGFGAAVSVLLTLGMLVWAAIWYRGFRRDFEAAR
jgi:multiple sugar transport system permease protein